MQYFSPSELGIICVSVSLLCCLLALLKERKARIELVKKYQAMQILHKNARMQYETLNKQVNELRVGNMNLGKKLAELTQDSCSKDEIKSIETKQKNFKKASQIAKFGGTVDEIIQSCDLCHAEAELILNINKNTFGF